MISNAPFITQFLKISQHLMPCPATKMYLERRFDDILEITEPQIRDLVERRGIFSADAGFCRW